MYCMMQWIKQLFLHIRLNIFFYYINIQNRQQNKLVNMVNGKDLLKKKLLAMYIFDIMFLKPDVYILKAEWYIDLYMTYIFLNERILHTFLKMFVFILGCNIKHWTLLCI